jgi:hypothetical protein
MNALLSIPLIALIAAGCSSNPFAMGRGTGIAIGRQYAAAESKVLATDAADAPECTTRKVVNTEVVTRPQVSVTPFDQAYTHALPDTSKATASPGVMPPPETSHSEFVERWTVSRCGERFHYRVTFRPNGDVLVAADK